MQFKNHTFRLFHILMAGTIFLLAMGLTGCDKRQSPAPVRDGVTIPALTPGTVKEETLQPAGPSKALSPKEVTAPHITIALLLPLSGKHASLGKAMQNAAEMALFEKGDGDIQLIIEDTKGTPQGARQAAEAAIQKQARLILGPLFSEETKAAGEVGRYYQIPVVSFSNNIAVAGQGVYTMGFSPLDQATHILAYAQQEGLTKVYAVLPASEFGQSMKQRLTVLAQNATIGSIETVMYNPSLTSLSKDLMPLQTASFDAVFIPEGGQTAVKLKSTLDTIGVQGPYRLLGTAQWDDSKVLKTPSLAGSYVSGPQADGWLVFKQRYEATYQNEPPRLASLAYDAVALVTVLKKHFAASPFGATSLTQQRGFAGIDGTFRFRGDGTCERKLAILQVAGGHLQTRVPAETAF